MRAAINYLGFLLNILNIILYILNINLNLNVIPNNHLLDATNDLGNAGFNDKSMLEC